MAQSDAITRTQAQTDRASASGLLRVASGAGSASAQTRIALLAEATALGAAQRAGLFIEAGTNGDNNVYVLANTFAVVKSRDANAVRSVPFSVRGGEVRMTTAFIDTLAIAGNAVIVPVMGEAENTIALPTADQWVNILTVGVSRAGAPTALIGSVQIDGFGASAVSFRLLRAGSVISGPWVNITGLGGAQASTGINFLDTDLGTGATQYVLQAARRNTGQYVDQPRALKRNILALHVKR